jgi:hypothetical protein
MPNFGHISLGVVDVLLVADDTTHALDNIV